MKEILLLILAGVLANNYAFEKFLGVTPMLGYSRRNHKLLAMGLAVTLVTVLTAAIAWPLQSLLEKYALGYLQVLVYVALILIVVYVVELIAKATLHQCLGIYFPLLALNSTVLGLALVTWLPASPIADALGLMPLPPSFFALLIGIVAAYIALTQLTKRRFIARHGELL